MQQGTDAVNSPVARNCAQASGDGIASRSLVDLIIHTLSADACTSRDVGPK